MKSAVRATQLFPATFREEPSEAGTPGHKLLLRAGYIRQVNAGVFILGPLAMRVLWKMEAIVREEMNNIGGLEIHAPIIQPAELWQKTGRLDRYVRDGIMFTGRDRKGLQFCLAPTAEEVVTWMTVADLHSHNQMPLTLWQMDWKFRDELRPRMGLIRSRTFRMKDSYSFDMDEGAMRESYRLHREAYNKMFHRLGFRFISVQADSGAIGGQGSAEFMAISEHGEDTLLTCSACDYGANKEKAVSVVGIHAYSAERRPYREVSTPNIRTVHELEQHFNLSACDMMKTIIYVADNTPVAVCVRGDLEINEVKLQNMLGCEKLEIAADAMVDEVTGAPVGFAGPIGMAKPCRIIFDFSVEPMTNILCGRNMEDVHLLDVNFGRDLPIPETFYDVRSAQAGDGCANCGAGILSELRGIEIGHVFMLQQGYAKKLKVTFQGADGSLHTPWMGCYGVGTTRCLQALVEQYHDADGIQWPKQVAPFQVAIVPTGAEGSIQWKKAEGLFQILMGQGHEVVFDDRPLRFGAKMKDALLIGYPYILVAGRDAEADQYEVHTRATGKKALVYPAQLSELIHL